MNQTTPIYDIRILLTNTFNLFLREIDKAETQEEAEELDKLYQIAKELIKIIFGEHRIYWLATEMPSFEYSMFEGEDKYHHAETHRLPIPAFHLENVSINLLADEIEEFFNKQLENDKWKVFVFYQPFNFWKLPDGRYQVISRYCLTER